MKRRAPDPFGLRGKVAVITGATKGIGRAVADGLAEAGARVVVTSRHERDCERVAAALRKRHRIDALGVAVDVTVPAQVRRLFQAVARWRKGPIRVLANVAGHPVVPRIWNTPLHRFKPAEVVEAFAPVYEVDLQGSRLCTYYALKDMLRGRGGSIVYVSSTPALVGYKGIPYTEAKAGILGLMRDVAREYGPKGIRANAIAPGNIRTGWLDAVTASERKTLERENPLRRFGEPREVADLVRFLSGSASSFITGQVVVIDGGTVMR